MPVSGHQRRVLIIVQNLPVPFDRRVWHEATTLARNGYRVSVICPKGHGAPAWHEVIEGVSIYRHPSYEAKGRFGYALEYFLSLCWEFLLAGFVYIREGFDVVHVCNPPDMLFLVGGFYKFFFRKKFIYDQHDLCPELFTVKFGGKGLLCRLMYALERATYRAADISVATNESCRRIALTRGHMKPEKVHIVRSGPDCERMKPGPATPELKHGRAFLVGYLGVIGRQDGVDHLIEAARHIVYGLRREDIHFTVIGGGPALEDMKRLCAARGLAGHMDFLGYALDDRLLPVLNSADLCVSPDAVNEMNDKCTMNKIMEYMALGKPIVQFDVREGRISAGAASLYAKPNDAVDFAGKIIELLDNPSRRAQMGAFGRARVENELAWRYEAPKLLAAYEAVFS